MATDDRPLLPDLEGPARRSWWKKCLLGLGLVAFVLLCTGVGAAYYLAHKMSGRERFAIRSTTQELFDLRQVVFNPSQVFPGRDRINILCLGLDRNWTRDGRFHYENARTDTLMLATLDLRARSVSVISIPRDMRVRMPGTNRYTRINEAHARGGAEYAIRAVEEFLDVEIDYYIAIKQEAVEAGVDAIGGIWVDVEKRMKYTDNWGQLEIDLEEGYQRLDGDQVVGYLRFRNDAEGDFGRMRRQQQVIQILAREMKEPQVVFQLPKLLDVLQQQVRTDLGNGQLLALGAMFHHVQPQDIVSATVPAVDRTLGGIAYLEPVPSRMRLLVDWLVHGDEVAGNRLIRVEVVNGSESSEVARRVANWLENEGFQVVYRGRAPGGKIYDTSVFVERGNLPRVARRVRGALGVQGQIEHESTSGNPTCTVIVGEDLRADARFAHTAVELLPPATRNVP